MPTKKKTTSGPKATLMKKNLAQLKAQAKKLKIKGFSTKKKEALVNSIMMAQARKKKSSAPKKSMAAGKRMMKKRGAKPNRVMRNPARTGRMRTGSPLPMSRNYNMMGEYNGWPNYETWLMNVWYGDYFYDLLAEGIEDGSIDIEMQKDAYDLGQYFESQIDLLISDEIPPNGFVTDLILAGLGKVNWYSLGDHYKSEYPDEDF